MNKILLNLKEKNMALTPLHDRVLVRLLDAETKSPGVSVIPDAAKEKPTTGQVLAVGQGRITESGAVVSLTVKVGDTVMFGKHAGQTVKVNSEEVTVLREEDILAIIE
jgi:chaperonin GroES